MQDDEYFTLKIRYETNKNQTDNKLTFKASKTKTFPQKMSTKITAKRLIFIIFSAVKTFAGAVLDVSADGEAVIDSMKAAVELLKCDGSKSTFEREEVRLKLSSALSSSSIRLLGE